MYKMPVFFCFKFLTCMSILLTLYLQEAENNQKGMNNLSKFYNQNLKFKKITDVFLNCCLHLHQISGSVHGNLLKVKDS